MEIEEIQEREEELFKVASEGYYKKPEMVRFLLIENLALKNLLFQKELISHEEFEQHTKLATTMLDIEVKRQLDEWRANNPKESVLMDLLVGKSKGDSA